MSNLVARETADLFDPVSGRWRGVMDLLGAEQIIDTSAANTVIALPLPSGGDDSATIQQAMNTASALGASLPVGQYVKVKGVEGATYIVNGLEFKSNVWLDMTNCYIKRSANGSSIATNSMIRTIDGLTLSSYYGKYKNIRMTGGVWDNLGFTCPANIIRFENVQDGLIENVTVKHNAGAQSWAFQVGGQRIRVINPVVLGGSLVFQDGVHITHGDSINVIGGYIESGDDPLPVGIDSASASETWDDEGLTNVTLSGIEVNATNGCLKVYYGLNTATGMPLAGKRGTIDGVYYSGITGRVGKLSNGGIYIVDTTTLTFSVAPVTGNTSGTLAANYTGTTGTEYWLQFSDGTTRKATLTNGSTTVTWATALPAGTFTTSVKAVDPTRIKNIHCDVDIKTGDTNNNGVNSMGVFVFGATNVNIKGTIDITDTANGTFFASGKTYFCMGGDFQLNIPSTPAGGGLKFYDSDAIRVHNGTLGGGVANKGNIELFGARVLVHDMDFPSIPTSGAPIMTQSSGSTDIGNTLMVHNCRARKAIGATSTRFYVPASVSAAFMRSLVMRDIDIQGQTAADSIDQFINATNGIAGDAIDVDGIRGNGAGINHSTTRAIVNASVTGTYTPQCAAFQGNRMQLTLTGNTTIAAPTGMAIGTRLVFELTQDATGSRTVTWNAVFKFVAAAWVDAAAANVSTRIEFEWNGTNWMQINVARWI